jgi:glycosyltransferase involved in cell wall biosynthesis
MTMKHTPIAVIVPAYNEEMVIVETLENLLTIQLK